MPLIEREEHLAALTEYRDDAVAGSGRFVLLGGEAGVGKSSLIEAFVADTDVRTALGACDRLATPRPLAPVLEVASQLGVRSSTPRDELFGAVLDAVKQEPTLLVIEDVHWADGVTRDFLLYIAKRIGPLPVLAIASYRDDEGGADDPLRVMVGEAGRFQSTRRIGLPRFSRTGVKTLVEGSGLDPIEVHRLTGGNPYFVTEVLATGSLAPATVTDAVVSRAAALSKPARRALEVASQLGARFDALLLADASEGDAVGIDECLERRLLHAEDGHLAFSHEIARAAIEDETQPVRRIAIHRSILRALEARGDADTSRLAHHAAAAGDGDAVIRYALDAAAHASKMGAHTEARIHLANARRFASKLDDEGRARLLDDLSWECQLTDKVDDAIEAREASLEIWQRLGDMKKVGNAHRILARLYWYKVQDTPADRHQRAAIEVLETLPPGPELARAYGDMSGSHMVRNRAEPAIEYARKAIELGERCGSDEVVAHALNNLGSALAMSDRQQEGLPYLERSLQMSLDNGWTDHASRAYINLTSALLHRFDFSRGEVFLEEGIAFAEDRDLAIFSVCLMAERMYVDITRGRWDVALAEAVSLDSRSKTKQISQSGAAYTTGIIAVRRGEPDARELAQEALDMLNDTDEVQRRIPAASALAEEAWLRGDPEGVKTSVAMIWDEVLDRGSSVELGMIASWFARIGEPTDLPKPVGHPYDLQLQGRWAEAAEAWRTIGAPYDMACALYETDEVGALNEAFETFDRLGAKPGMALVATKLRALGARVPRGPRTATRDNPAGLTARESEILALVAEGLTNSEIATALFISEKTVEHHVSRILAKLGASSRREAARAARDMGLALQT